MDLKECPPISINVIKKSGGPVPRFRGARRIDHPPHLILHRGPDVNFSELQAIYETDGGAQVPEPVGFSARAGGYLGAVEVSRPGRVWLEKGLDPKAKAQASCLFAGLMLYQPPTVSED